MMMKSSGILQAMKSKDENDPVGLNEVIRFDEDEDYVSKKPEWYILSPRSAKRVLWDLLVLQLLLVVFVTVPLGLAFGERFERHFATADLVIDCIFLFDVFLNFFTGFRLDDDEDYIEMQPREIAKNYLGSWFWVDVISCPSVILLIITGIPYASELSVVKLLKGGKMIKMLKMVKMLKMLRVSKMMGSYALELEEFFMRSTMRVYIRLAHLLALVTISGHLLACFWLAVSDTTEGKISWMYAYRDGLDDDSVSSEYQSQLYVEWGMFEQYVTAMYFAITTMSTVGFGDICPSSTGERLYMIAAMVLGGGVYGFIIGSLASVVTDQDTNKQKFYERMDTIHSYMNHREFPYDLRHKIHTHFRKFFEVNSALDEKAIINDLSDGLRLEVMACITNRSVSVNYLFCDLSRVELGRLAMVLKPTQFAANSGPVVVTGDSGMEMFVVTEGQAVCFRPPKMEADLREACEFGVFHCKLVPGDSFGEMVCMGLNPTYNATVVCSSRDGTLDVLGLSRTDLLTVFPSGSATWNKLQTRAIEHSTVNFLLQAQSRKDAGVRGLKKWLKNAGNNGGGLAFDAEVYLKRVKKEKIKSVVSIMQKKRNVFKRAASVEAWPSMAKAAPSPQAEADMTPSSSKENSVGSFEGAKSSNPTSAGKLRWGTIRALDPSAIKDREILKPARESSVSESGAEITEVNVFDGDEDLKCATSSSTTKNIQSPDMSLSHTFDSSIQDIGKIRSKTSTRNPRRFAVSTPAGGAQDTLPPGFADSISTMLRDALDDIGMLKHLQMDSVAKREVREENFRREIDFRIRRNEESIVALARNLGFDISQSLSSRVQEPIEDLDPSVLKLAVSAKWLPSKDSNGLSDPYLRIRDGDTRFPIGDCETLSQAEAKRSVLYQSEVVMRSLSPKWKTCTLPLPEEMIAAGSPGGSGHGLIVFEVWDWDRECDDDFIGFVKVPLAELLALPKPGSKIRGVDHEDAVIVLELQEPPISCPMRTSMLRMSSSVKLAPHCSGSIIISAAAV